MNILVLGAGAIGSVFGGFLAQAGHDVVLLGRKAHIQALMSTGLLIEGIWGTHLAKNVRGATTFSEALESGIENFDAALLTVKSYDTESTMRELIEHIPDPPPVISLQNGLGNCEIIESFAGRQKTIGGRVIFGVEYIKPGNVKVTVCADKTYIGCLPGGGNDAFVQHMAQTFKEAGIDAAATSEIEKFIWGKVLYNCALNPLATILDVHYGKLLSCDETKSIMKNIVREIFTVTNALHIELFWKEPQEYIKLLFEELIPKTFEHHPSMLQDIHRGKRTEIDALNGAVVRMGSSAGADVPYNQTITQLIKAKELFR